jgi:hypothetical protein
VNAIDFFREKQVLSIIDALYGASIHNQQAPDFVPNCLLMSTDPVAVDRVGTNLLYDNGCLCTESAHHIETAAGDPYNLGISDPANIEIVEINNPSSTGVPDSRVEVPRNLVLYPNYPNPFNPGTTLDFQVWQKSTVHLDILDSTGRQIRSLISQVLPEGRYTRFWDGRDGRGRTVPSGSYIIRLRAMGMQRSQVVIKAG